MSDQTTPDSSFNLHILPTDEATIVALTGHAHAQYVDDLRQQLLQLAAQKPPCIVIDLRRLDFIASLTLGALVEFRNQIQCDGGRIMLAGANPHVSEVFAKTRLRDLFPMFETPDDALREKPC